MLKASADGFIVREDHDSRAKEEGANASFEIEIIREYKKITSRVEASDIKQEKFHEKIKIIFLEKLMS